MCLEEELVAGLLLCIWSHVLGPRSNHCVQHGFYWSGKFCIWLEALVVPRVHLKQRGEKKKKKRKGFWAGFFMLLFLKDTSERRWHFSTCDVGTNTKAICSQTPNDQGVDLKKKTAKVHEVSASLKVVVLRQEGGGPDGLGGTFHWDVSGREEKGAGWCVTAQLGSFLGWQTLPAELKADSHAEWRGACILFHHFATGFSQILW